MHGRRSIAGKESMCAQVQTSSKMNGSSTDQKTVSGCSRARRGSLFKEVKLTGDSRSEIALPVTSKDESQGRLYPTAHLGNQI